MTSNIPTPAAQRRIPALEGLARDLLAAVSESAIPTPEGPILRDFDWAGCGIASPYVIFMTGRCGSTWLASLLKATQLAGNPGEFFNAHVAKHIYGGPAPGFREYFDHVVAATSSNGRFGIKLDDARLKAIEPLIDWPSVFPVRATTCFFMYRSDLLEQAWSWASARKSGIWHQWHGKAKGIHGEESIPTWDELCSEMVRIRMGETFLGAFFARQGYAPRSISYESLVADQDAAMNAILLALDVDPEVSGKQNLTAEPHVSKMDYPHKECVLADFRVRHADALSRLEQERFGISPEELKAMLLGQH